MNIPPKYEDLVVHLDAALERNAVLQAELEEKQAFAEMFYSKQVLAETKIRNAEGREAALRESLTDKRGEYNKLGDRYDDLRQRLTVAEKRADDMVYALARIQGRAEMFIDDGMHMPTLSIEAIRDIAAKAALKPAEGEGS